MAAPQIAALPELFELTGGMQIRVTALDATTGATVAGVSITTAYADVEYLSAEDIGPPIIPPVLDPAFFAGEAA